VTGSTWLLMKMHAPRRGDDRKLNAFGIRVVQVVRPVSLRKDDCSSALFEKARLEGKSEREEDAIDTEEDMRRILEPTRKELIQVIRDKRAISWHSAFLRLLA